MAVLQCMLHEAGRVSRNRNAFIADNLRIQYGEWDLMVSATAVLLRDAGVTRDTRVALYMENGWAQATLILAIIRVGGIACPINTRLPVVAVHTHLQLIDCTVLIARVRPESQDLLPGVTCLDPDGLVSVALTSGQEADTFLIPMDQPATIVFTSGSSGRPKPVLHTYGNHYYSAYGANLNVRLRSGDCWLLSLPLYHVGGLGILFRCLQSGAALAEMKQADRLDEALARFPITHCSCVPTQLKRLLEAGGPPEVRKRMKAILLGGSAIPSGLLSAAASVGLPVYPTYGLTEMTSQVTAGRPGTKPGETDVSNGHLLRYRELRITEEGEIQVRGATLFSGYLEGRTLTRPVDEEGWFATGDLGQWGDDGSLVVRGRKDQRFISGGENIYPESIEQALLQLDGVSRAVVVPVPDEDFGHRPVAFIDSADRLEAQDWRAALRERLPGYMIPVCVYAWPESTPDPDALKADRAWFRRLAEKAKRSNCDGQGIPEQAR